VEKVTSHTEWTCLICKITTHFSFKLNLFVVAAFQLFFSMSILTLSTLRTFFSYHKLPTQISLIISWSCLVRILWIRFIRLFLFWTFLRFLSIEVMYIIQKFIIFFFVICIKILIFWAITHRFRFCIIFIIFFSFTSINLRLYLIIIFIFILFIQYICI